MKPILVPKLYLMTNLLPYQLSAPYCQEKTQLIIHENRK